ncbi:MAG: hypothetical protein KC414_00280, partial [Romboutsia sp.]|nr:hypothetical protein [Romboutsia sp.]
SQNCQTVVVKSDKCCYKTTVETVVGNEDINNVTFPENPNAYDHHIVQFDDSIVIYEFYGGSWLKKIRHLGNVSINSIPSAAFASSLNPKITEVETWIDVNLSDIDKTFSILTYNYNDSRLDKLNGQVYIVSNGSAIKVEDLRESSGVGSTITLYVDPVSGSDTQNLELYLEGTARYLTLEQLFKDLVYVDKELVSIIVENSTLANPALSTTLDVSGKVISLSVNNPGTGYLKFSGSTVFRNCNIQFDTDATLDFKESTQVVLINSSGWIRRNGITIELPTTPNLALFKLRNSGLHIEDYAFATAPDVNVVFNANNSAFVVSDGATSNVSLHGVNWINTGVYTTCKIVGYSTDNGGNHTGGFMNLSVVYSNDLADSNVYFGGPALVRVVQDYLPSDTSNDTACIFSTAGDELLPLNEWNKKCLYAPPYKVYRALVTQSGTSAPTAVVLENTLGGTPVWSYITPGTYRLTLSGAFTLNKTAINIGNNNFFSTIFNAPYQVLIDHSVVDYIEVYPTDIGTLTQANDLLINTYIEILVYP